MGRSFSHLITGIFADQRVRFLAVGGINTVLGYAVFAVFAHWVFAAVPLGYLLALIVSYGVAITVAFILYRRFVFAVKGNVLVDFIRFVGVYAVSIAVNAAALPLLVELGHMNPLTAQAVVLVVTTIVSYVGHKYFSFRRRHVATNAAGFSSSHLADRSAGCAPESDASDCNVDSAS